MKKSYIYLFLAISILFFLPIQPNKADIIASLEFVKQQDEEAAKTPQENKAAAEQHRKVSTYHKGNSCAL